MGWCIVNQIPGFGSGLEVLQIPGMQAPDAGFALPETHHDHYNGGQGAEKLFLVLALLSCLRESRMAGSSLLKFRCFTEEPDFIFSGLFCN